jgi:hypothetical protein
LYVVADRCPNLVAEAGLYRYSADEAQRGSEVPVDEHNHALAALRYLVSRIDVRFMGRMRRAGPDSGTASVGKRDEVHNDEAMWTILQ